MDDATYVETRRSVHGLAELVLAGPRYRATRQMRLRVLPDGIGTWDQPGPGSPPATSSAAGRG
jgi:hypothetical protein